MGLLVALSAILIAGCGGGERQDEDEPEGEFPVEIVAAEFPAKQRLAETADLTLTVANVGEETIPDLAVTAFTVADAEAPEIDAEEAVGINEDDSAETEGGEETATDSEAGAIPEDELGSAVDQALEEELQEAETSEDSDEESTEEGAEETTSTEQELPQAEGAFSVLSDQPGLAIPSRPVWILEQGYPRIAGTEAGAPPDGEIAGSGGAETAQTNTFSFGSLDPNETTEIVFRVTAVQDGTFTVHYRIAAGLQGKAVAVNEDGSVPEGEFVVRISDVPPQTRVDDAGNVVPIEKGDIIGQAGSDEQKEELGQ
jgi:hypothetical protein